MEAPAKAPRKIDRPWAVMLIAFLPLAFDWTYKILLHPRPHWIHYYDPENIYFYGGLLLRDGKIPGNVDNPGVPVYLISAAIHYLMGFGPLDIDHFRVFGYILACLLNVVAAYFLVRHVLTDLPGVIQVAALWTYFMCPRSLQCSNIWSPEIFYFSTASLVLLAACSGDWSNLSRRRILTIGLSVGLCCALKWTFIAFVAALIVGLLLAARIGWPQRLRNAAVGSVGIVLGFVAATSIFAQKYPRMLERFFQFAVHDSIHGEGSITLPSATVILSNLYKAVSHGRGWHLWLVGCLTLLGFWLWRGHKRGNHLSHRAAFFVIFCLVGLATSYALATSKEGMLLHYLLPTGIAGLLVFILAMRLAPSNWPMRFRIPIFALAVLVLCYQISKDIRLHRRLIRNGLRTHNEIARSLEELTQGQPEPTVVYSWRLPQPSFGLRFVANERYLRVIEEKFPYEGHYVPWRPKIFIPSSRPTWDYLVIRENLMPDFPEPLSPVLASVGNVRIVGKADSPPAQAGPEEDSNAE